MLTFLKHSDKVYRKDKLTENVQKQQYDLLQAILLHAFIKHLDLDRHSDNVIFGSISQYQDRLRTVGLTTLETKRLKADMILKLIKF